MKKPHLADGYSFSGFTAYRSFEMIEGLYNNRVVTLKRNQKKLNVFPVGNLIKATMIKRQNWFAIFLVAIFMFMFNLSIEESNAKQLGM